MKKYEVMFILRSNLENDAIKENVEKISNLFTSNKAKVLECKEWGVRELAYEIDHNKRGYYVGMLVEAPVAAVNEFNRVARINENIIRDIVVNYEG